MHFDRQSWNLIGIHWTKILKCFNFRSRVRNPCCSHFSAANSCSTRLRLKSLLCFRAVSILKVFPPTRKFFPLNNFSIVWKNHFARGRRVKNVKVFSEMPLTICWPVLRSRASPGRLQDRNDFQIYKSVASFYQIMITPLLPIMFAESSWLLVGLDVA